MKDNEIIKDIPFEEKTAWYKKDIKDFFSRYKNESGGEDCIEVCLIRAGYRTVLKAEEEINRQKAEIERLKSDLEYYQKGCHNLCKELEAEKIKNF